MQFNWDTCVTPYKRAWFFKDDAGHVVWRPAVGGAVEVLSCEPLDPRLLAEMLRKTAEHRDDDYELYALAHPTSEAISFWVRCGFRLAEKPTVGGRVLFWQTASAVAAAIKPKGKK